MQNGVAPVIFARVRSGAAKVLGSTAVKQFRFLAGLVLRAAMRALPRRHRFGAAVRMARWGGPLALRWGIVSSPGRCVLESPPDFILAVILLTFNRWGIAYDPHVLVEGLAVLDAALATGRGVLLAGPHTHLTAAGVRHLFESGYDLTAVAAPGLPVPVKVARGVPIIERSPLFLLAIRELLLARKPVFAMIDWMSPAPGKMVPMEAASGTMYVSDALLRLAERCGTEVVFIASRLTPRGIVSTLAPPRGAAHPGLAEFARFVRDFEAGRASPPVS